MFLRFLRIALDASDGFRQCPSFLIVVFLIKACTLMVGVGGGGNKDKMGFLAKLIPGQTFDQTDSPTKEGMTSL